MKKRLFVSIKLPESFVKAFDQCLEQENLKGIKVTPLQNFHLTVYFLGYLEEKLIPQVKIRLKEVFLKTKPFKIIFQKIIFAPPRETPRMIWAQFQSPNFKALVATVGKTLDEFLKPRYKIKKKQILPHVTLARFKQTKIFKTVKLKEPKIKEKKFVVDCCSLMESKLKRSGPVYFLIENFNLFNEI